MKVIFLEDVPGTAEAGEVKEVKNGFARNFLLPRELAAPATKNQLQRLNIIEKGAQQKRLKLSDDARVVAGALDGTAITIEVRVGPTGRLFGAVTGRHIADEVNKLTDRDLDHHSILLGDAIHDPGDYDVKVRLYRDVTAQIKVSVVPEGYLEEQAQKAAAVTALSEGQPESATDEAPAEASIAESGADDEAAEAEHS
jgi:large subunit ribosomal protein L9